MDLNLPGPLILASGSPRRSKLLRDAGLNFHIIVPDVEENDQEDIPAEELPSFLAEKKAGQVRQQCNPGDIILAADTLVFLDGKIIGKPADREDAIRMLGMLSGNKHRVITGVCILYREISMVFSAVTEVYFRALESWEILYYIDHYKPYDKAGAYAIQEWIGMVAIERISGCYYNVTGLPLSLVLDKLKGLPGRFPGK